MTDPANLVTLIAALALAGAAIGFLAGLFGIGGGAISVPVFYEVFGLLGHAPDVAMPLAVGTSLAVIIPTSINSARGHYLRGTVDMNLLRIWALPVLAGVLCGSFIASFAAPWLFQVIFILVASLNAIKLLSGGSGWRLAESLPGKGILRIYGAAIGLISALMGIGGGAVSNLMMTLHNVSIHRAVSTSAGVGLLIAIPGTFGYVAAGWGKPDLPGDALGYVSIATFLMTIPTTILTTRLGVRLAHNLTRRKLETAFGLFLLLVSLRFIFDLAQ
ncbi:sulfite exporter TauE/SafE family protein [Abyssibius alkaniclasticus]|uniref:sulfite exporter TauE/SafE family protein n=1 Tax=Abyssibius alkaniclasticus TaxID=2881234 RepID=UPI004057D1CD